jgi:hypothetical protein
VDNEGEIKIKIKLVSGAQHIHVIESSEIFWQDCVY